MEAVACRVGGAESLEGVYGEGRSSLALGHGTPTPSHTHPPQLRRRAARLYVSQQEQRIKRSVLRWHRDRKTQLAVVAAAAMLITRRFRQLRDRRAFQERLRLRCAAVRMQTTWRRYITRKDFLAYQSVRQEAIRRHHATVVLQDAWRRRRKRVHARQRIIDVVRQIQRMQKIYRRFLFNVGARWGGAGVDGEGGCMHERSAPLAPRRPDSRPCCDACGSGSTSEGSNAPCRAS